MAVSNRFQLFSHDVTNIMNDIWKNNDIQQEQTVNGVKQTISLRDYLNVIFFTFREELVSVNNRESYADYNSWFSDAIKSIDKSFARFNIYNEENTVAQDIDFAAFSVDFEIIIQPHKMEALEKYWNNLRKIFLGTSYPMITANGKQTQLFITLGNLLPQDGIDTSQVGKSIILTADISITSLVGGLTYSDYEIRIRFGDDLTESWYKLAFTNLTRSMVNTGDKVNTQAHPQHIGHLPQMTGFVAGLTIYDMRNGANAKLNDISLKSVALAERKVETPSDIDTEYEAIKDYEPPVIQLRIWNKVSKKEYLLITYPTEIQQTIINGSFNALTVTLTLAAQNIDYVKQEE